MGQLKPVGSEKLTGDAKIKRILELTYYQMPNEKPINESTTKKSTSGTYGIVKEKDGFYVKKGINESSLDYIGGLFMKNKNRFSSYNEALKKMEFLVEQEKLTEATKYVLKQPKPKVIEPEPTPVEEEPPMETTPPETEESPSKLTTDDDIESGLDDVETEEPDGEDNYLKSVQKYTGKLTQKLMSSKDEIQSDDIKYVINMVLSSVDLTKLDDADMEDIIDRLENPEESTNDDGMDDEIGGEMGDEDNISQLEELINTPIDDVDDEPTGLTDRTLPKKDNGSVDFNQEMETNEEVDPELETKEIDMDELTDMINNSVKQSLSKYFKD